MTSIQIVGSGLLFLKTTAEKGSKLDPTTKLSERQLS